jgi:hypothetical protein
MKLELANKKPYNKVVRFCELHRIIFDPFYWRCDEIGYSIMDYTK